MKYSNDDRNNIGNLYTEMYKQKTQKVIKEDTFGDQDYDNFTDEDSIVKPKPKLKQTEEQIKHIGTIELAFQDENGQKEYYVGEIVKAGNKLRSGSFTNTGILYDEYEADIDYSVDEALQELTDDIIEGEQNKNGWTYIG